MSHRLISRGWLWLAICLAALPVVFHLRKECLAKDLRTSGWKKSPGNPVLSLSPTGTFDSQNIFAPAIAKHQGRYYLFYAGGPSGPATGEDFVNYQLGLAISGDGVIFVKQGAPLLPLGTRDNFHATPALLRDPQGDLLLDEKGTWHMVFAGNRADDVEHATSRDGIVWQKAPRNPIFRRAYAPNLIKMGRQLRMYYIHKPDGANWEIHLATGRDFDSLKPHADNPLLTVTQEWEARNLVYPYVLREGSTWVMFYAAYWKSPYGGTKTAIGTATSSDGVHWAKNADNPVLTPSPGSPYDSVYTSSQAVIRDGDHYKLYYAGRVDAIHKYFSIGLATKPAGK